METTEVLKEDKIFSNLSENDLQKIIHSASIEKLKKGNYGLP